MSSRQSTLLDLDDTTSKASYAASRSTLPSAFGRLMGSVADAQKTIKRD
jgi:hypothetical protein